MLDQTQHEMRLVSVAQLEAFKPKLESIEFKLKPKIKITLTVIMFKLFKFGVSVLVKIKFNRTNEI